MEVYSVKCSRFNTQPPEGGWAPLNFRIGVGRSFNTQPPEGGWCRFHQVPVRRLCFNTQPPEGGWFLAFTPVAPLIRFQHTAARRRLGSFRKNYT